MTTFVFRPVEANLTHNTELLSKMSPYLVFIVGSERVSGPISNKGGKHPKWNDTITVPAVGKSTQIVVEVMDHDKITKDDLIGSFVIDLLEIQNVGQVSKWYPITHKGKAAGEILLEGFFGASGSFKAGAGIQQHGHVATGVAGGLVGGIREEVHVNQAPNKVFIEQKQVVEPHTFMKEVDVVETRAVTQQIEVMEAVKVVKDVQYTQAVPVTKQIEVVEPQVVVKEVEVIEPRLVTKTIQVVENVPVKRQVEVIENKTVIQEVETMEPQTFTKQVEVTEHHPVMKTVTVTEPVHLKKAVEFVEPVITTKTITKQLQEAVIVDEKVTQHVGPATVVGVTQETYTTGVHATGAILTEEQRIIEEQRLLKGGVHASASTHHHHHTDKKH